MIEALLRLVLNVFGLIFIIPSFLVIPGLAVTAIMGYKRKNYSLFKRGIRILLWSWLGLMLILFGFACIGFAFPH